MKNKLIERITRSFAPPARFFALLFAVCAVSSAWAAGPTAAAVWEGGFDNIQAQNGWSLVDWNDAHAADWSSVTIDRANQGLMINSDSGKSGITVLVKYSGLSASSSANRVIAASCVTSSHQYNRTGITLKSNGTLVGLWNSSTTGNSDTDNGTASGSIAASGVMAFTYGSDGTWLYYGSDTASISSTAAWGASGLKSSSDHNNSSIYGAAIGGMCNGASRSGYEAAIGMTVSGIAVFDKVLSNEEMTSYCWPSTPVVDGDNNCTFTVTDNALYEIAANATYNTITFDVAAGKKLVLEGSATLTASSGITITGGGVVEASSAAALSGTLKGSGTVAYVGVKPTGLTYSDPSWTGTVWIKGYNGGNTNIAFDSYSNSGSKTKVSGVYGCWLSAQATYNNEVVLDDDTYGFALKVQNGNSPQNNDNNKNRCTIFKKLSGTGTLTAGGDSYSAWPVVKIIDISDFTGNINCGSSGTSLAAVICNENEELPDSLYNLFNSNPRRIYISAGRTGEKAVSIPSGATWSANNGIYVATDGTLNIAGGTVSGTLYGNATVTAASTASSLTVASGSRLTANAALSGSVTVASGGNVDVAAASAAAFTVQSGGTLSTAAAISGAINLTGTMNVIASGTLQFTSGSSVIQEGGTLNVVTGIAHMNVADRGIKGTINIQSGATFKSYGADRLNYSATSDGGIINVRANGTLDMDNTRWTMCKYNQINLYDGAVVTGTGDSGNGASLDMNVNSDGDDVAIHALGNATINAPIRSIRHNYGVFNVDEGKTLTFSGRLFTNKTTKKGLGTLKLTYVNGNAGTGSTSYTVPTLAEGTIEFAGEGAWTLDIGEGRDLAGYDYSGTGSMTVTAKQTGAECALGSDIAFENVANAALAPTVTLRNGGTVSPSLVGTTATYTGSGEISISGGATDLDLTCDDESINFDYASINASTWRDNDPVYTEDGVYARANVYTQGDVGTFLVNNSGAMTLAVIGSMSPTANTIFLSLGNTLSGGNGIVLVRTSRTDEVAIGYNEAGVVHKIAEMTVPNCATARHVYIITKEDVGDNSTFTVYLDGIKWKTLTISKLTFVGGGIQIGADFGGGIRDKAQSEFGGAAFIAIPNSESETGVLNAMRVYGRVITAAEIAEYTSVFPYVSPNGSSARTFTAASEYWIDETPSSEVWENSTGGNSGTPLTGAALNVTANVATEVTVNLASEASYEALTIGGAATRFVSGVASGSVKVTGMTVIGGTVTFAYGAVDVSGGPMTITEDGDITFDYSAYDISAIYTTTDIPLTSDVEQDDSKVHLVAPSADYRTVSLVYTSGHYAMRVTPDHEAGSDVYYKSGYFGKGGTEAFSVVLSDGTTPTVVFPGDIVVIDGKSIQDPIYVGELPDNVSSISIARACRLASGNASIAMLDGAVVAVADGVVATIQYNYNPINLGTVTFNTVGDAGTGSVILDNDSGTLDISGAVSGTAPIAIAAGRIVTVASTGSIANTVVLAGAGATLVVQSGGTVGNVESGDSDYTVKESSGTYSLVRAVATAGAGAEVPAASAADAVAQCAVALTAAQKTQGLQESYYKLTATEKESGTWVVTAELDENVVKVDVAATDMTALAAGSSTTATFTTSNTKEGLYYAIVTVSDPSVASPQVTVLAEDNAADDGAVITLTPTITFGSDAVLYFKWQVSDTETLTPVTP